MRWMALALLVALDGTTSPPDDGAPVAGEQVLAFTRTIIRTPPHPEPPPDLPPPVVHT